MGGRDRDKTVLDPRRTQLGVGAGKAAAEVDLTDQVVLDRYLVESRLGAGAMGVVYRGSDIQLHRGVAIKIMHAHLGAEPVMVGRFRREARVAARMQHENVVGVLDAGTHGKSPVMVLELAIGPTLRDVMDEELPVARVKQLIGGILHGLDHAHGAGLIHRDLKPENVIVETRAELELARIVDFGIAALVDPDDAVGSARLTGTGVVVGTPLYMAPEQALGEKLDPRVDLFALGVVMYEMLAGHPPFDGSVHEVVLANIKKDPPPITTVDPNLDRFARKLMARNLDHRIASARAAIELLALIDADPSAAALALGQHDLAKASAIIALPDPD
ncbi:MAG TPA: serine/threonine-protein kinase [Kofleriaceae bacterium]